MEQMLTARAVADALTLSDQTVYRLVADGTLRSYRVGKRRIGIDPQSVQEYLDKRSSNNPNLNAKDISDERSSK